MIVRVIPTSEGRLIEVVEGVLRMPPPPKVSKLVMPAKFKPIPDDLMTHAAYMRRQHAKLYSITGYREYLALRRLQEHAYTDCGRLAGRRIGMTKQQTRIALRKAKKQALIDMANLKNKNITFEDSASEEAMRTTLEIIRGPGAPILKLKAAKLILEFTKVKPTAKSEVTVATAEKWLDSLDDD